jgi:chromosome segregation ATPase
MTKGLPVSKVLAIFVCSIVLIGCKGRGSSSEEGSAEAKVLLAKVRSDLAKTKRELTDAKEELQAVREIRDELEQQLKQVTMTRDKALDAAEAAQRVIQNMTTQVKQKDGNVNQYEKEITDLKNLVEERNATIAEQQTTIAELEQIIAQLGSSEQDGNMEQPEETGGQGEVIE